MSLTSIVRDLTGTTSDLVPDSVIEHALAANRAYASIPIVWHTTRVGLADPGGVFETATLHDTNGSELNLETVGATIDARGGVLLDAAGTKRKWTVRGFVYDLHLVAAITCDAAAAAVAKEFSFTTDGQSFSRSDQAQAFRDAALQFRRLAKVRRVPGQRTDDAAAAGASSRRSRRG
jgi:hypothetical protein